MNFDFNEEQRALADTVRRFVARDYGFEKRRAILASPAGWSREVWQGLADLGVLAVNIDEGYGGLGYGPQETGLAMSAFGAGLLLEPYLAAAVIAPALIRRTASADFQEHWLPAIACGESIVVLAHADARGAPVTELGGNLSGRKRVVAHGGCADLLLVSAQMPNGDTGLYAVAPGSDGLVLHNYPTLDGQRAADVILDIRIGRTHRRRRRVRPHRSGARHRPGGTVRRSRRHHGRHACRDHRLSQDAPTVRSADRPLPGPAAPHGRHALHQEQARSMSYLAAMHCVGTEKTVRQRVLSAAKVTVGQACRFIAQNAVQLHGGMGMTDELMLSHWFKRLTAIEMSFGDTDSHLARFARLSRAA
jgi:alkylation response protein AidB-like acyl-CoA dehydrogenase